MKARTWLLVFLTAVATGAAAGGQVAGGDVDFGGWPVPAVFATLLALAGEAVMTMIYGPIGKDAVGLATMLAPMAGLAALWRLAHIMGGLHGLAAELVMTRCAALGGQAALLILLIIAPNAALIAVLTPVSMLLAAVVAPLLAPGLAIFAKKTATSAKGVALRSTSRRRAFRLMFS